MTTPFHSHWEYQKAKENAATMFNKLCTIGLSDSDNTEYVELCERIKLYELDKMKYEKARQTNSTR